MLRQSSAALGYPAVTSDLGSFAIVSEDLSNRHVFDIQTVFLFPGIAKIGHFPICQEASPSGV